MYGNIISVDIAKGSNGDGLSDVVRNMYQYWKPGMEMPTFDAPEETAPDAAVAAEQPTVAGLRVAVHAAGAPGVARPQCRSSRQVAGQSLATLATLAGVKVLPAATDTGM